MSESSGGVKPYIGPEETIPETTILSIGLGIVLAVILGAANVYLGLYAGMTVSASIPAAVVSMAILRGVFRRGTILENNIVQTIASTGESLAAGAIFTIPALILVGAWQNFEFWPTTIIIMMGGLFGVIFMVPLRRSMIVNRTDLTYPEGVACSEVLIVGQEGGSGLKTIAMGLGMGAAFKFLVSGIGVVKGTVEGAVAKGSSVFYLGSDMSVALVAVGYIVRLSVATQVFLGGAIGWLIALPLLKGYDGTSPPAEAAFEIWSSDIRYIGVGAMLVGGLYSLWSVRKGIVAGVSGLKGVTALDGKAVKRTDRDMPLTALVVLFLLATLGTMGLYQYLIQSFGATLVATVMMISTAFLFVAVATYIVGLVGSSNSPVSGMTICALLMTAGMMLAMGIEGDSAILATLGVAGVVCCAACSAGDIAQDLKTGQLVGASPHRQQWTEVIGVVIPAFIFAPVMMLLHNAYGIGNELRAPQAGLFASLVEGFFGDESLPWSLIRIGAVIGVGVIALDSILQKRGSSFRTHIMPVAVGIYLPLTLSVPILLGGLIQYATSRKKNEAKEGSDPGLLYGSGLIAGEALMGIGLAIPMAIDKEFLPKWGEEYFNVNVFWMISLALFGFFLFTYARVTRRNI
jgi:putative OPT family oligopeptide transporter